MTLTMKADVAAELVKRLRSGDYKQGTEKLAASRQNDDNLYHCCLGVLCEMAAEEGVVQRLEETEPTWTEEEPDDEYNRKVINFVGKNGNHDATLPIEVVEWAGIVTVVDDYAGHDSDTEPRALPNFDDFEGVGRFEAGIWVTTKDADKTLAGMNDNGKSFEEIATFIEEKVVKA